MEPKNKIILRKSSPYLPEETVNQIARKTGFSKRVRKITPFAFFQSCCLLSVYAVNSLSSWAVLMGFLVRKTISKQAIAKRLDSESVLFIRHLFFAALKTTSRLNFRIDNGDFSGFRRVLIHDSTSVRLPDRLISLFPGTGNQKKENAALKIQTVYDALSDILSDSV